MFIKQAKKMQLPKSETVQALLGLLLMCFDTILSATIVQPLEDIPSQISDEYFNNSRQKRDNDRRFPYLNQRDVLMHLVVDNTVSPVLTTDRDVPMDIWQLSEDKFTKRQKFAEYSADGTVTIQRSGFYMIYANVQLVNPPRLENWYWYTIKINGREFLRCMRERGLWTGRIPGCRASGGVYLSKGLQVTFHSTQTGQEVTPGSFWGLANIKKGRGFLRKQFHY